jgi:hypothetical protein
MANELRKRVADILHTEHRVSQTKLRGLSDKDTNELRAIASGAHSSEYRIKALSVLASTRDTTAIDVFRSALRDMSANFDVRAAGATWLSRLGGMAAEGELMASLAAEELPVVQHKIVAGLARVGSEASLKQLADAVQRMDPSVREHARFTQAVIAYRAGISGFELPVVDIALRLPAPSMADTSARMDAARPEDALRVIEQTVSDSYGVSSDPEGVALIQCGRRNLATVIHTPLTDAVGHLLIRPSIIGYVAVRAETDGSFSTGLLVLSWPNGNDALHISMNRLSGRSEYFGKGTVDGNVVHFVLDAVRAPGATETTLTGTLVGSRIAELQVASGQTLERLRPTPMVDH